MSEEAKMTDNELAEYQQMCSAPSDGYSAGAWCEAANALLLEVLRLRDIQATFYRAGGAESPADWNALRDSLRLAVLDARYAKLSAEEYAEQMNDAQSY